MANAQAWRDFLLSEYRRRDFKSYREFGRWLGVSNATISRALDTDDPALPGLEFLLIVHEKTGVALTDLIELVYPEAVGQAETPVSARIQAQRYQQDAWREATGMRWRGSSFVFTTKAGRPLGHSTPYEALQRYCRQLGLPALNLHGLRHLHASMLINRNVPIPAIAARLGHSNPGITMRVYAHSIPGQDQIAAAAIEAALERVRVE